LHNISGRGSHQGGRVRLPSFVVSREKLQDAALAPRRREIITKLLEKLNYHAAFSSNQGAHAHHSTIIEADQTYQTLLILTTNFSFFPSYSARLWNISGRLQK
jgi:hypothetical protein